jgi:2-dehydro-3-deoxygluconokinase
MAGEAGEGNSVTDAFDVVVLGEVLVEFHANVPLREARTLRLSFSGDALNAAAAAVAAGARTALLTAVGDDEVGEALLHHATELGVDVGLVRRDSGPNGAYLLWGDTTGNRDFLYWRTGSAASTLSADDVRAARATLAAAGGLVVSGITAALSLTAREAVITAADLVSRSGGHVIYDPNFRRRLTTSAAARDVLVAVAPLTTLITPSCPGDTEALLDTADPVEAARRGQELGAQWVAVTAGAQPVTVRRGDETWEIPVPSNPVPVDATGAGDVLVGTTVARLALGDDPDDALRIGVAAASLSVSGAGGTGHVPRLQDTLALAAQAIPDFAARADGHGPRRHGTRSRDRPFTQSATAPASQPDAPSSAAGS